MPVTHYEDAVALMEQYPEILYYVGKQTESAVHKAEIALEIKFPPLYRRLLLEYGRLAFGSIEFMGIGQKENTGKQMDIVEYTFHLRELTNLSTDVLPIMESGTTAYEYGLLLNKPNEQGEPPVIVFHIHLDINDYTPEVEAEDFGIFLLNQVKDAIEFYLSYRDEE